MVRTRRAVLVILGAVAVAWILLPAFRAALLLSCPRSAPGPEEIAGMPVEAVRFAASDGVALAGWYVADPAAVGTVVLVHGFKSDRREMVARASFLRAAHYAVLLYDGRGCGESAGTFGVGATEDRDVIGAASYLTSRRWPGWDRIAVLGLSLGAGDALLAAAHDERIRAVIADSAWEDQRLQLDRMSTVALGPVAIPVIPYGPPLVDALIGGRLEDARPQDAVARVSPRAVLFIHCTEDDNATTPVEGAKAMFTAAGPPKDIWLVPGCRHAGAAAARPTEYAEKIISFLREQLR